MTCSKEQSANVTGEIRVEGSWHGGGKPVVGLSPNWNISFTAQPKLVRY